MIQVQGLSKYYFGRRAIENVSFKIEEGEIIGLLGLNGAGKSTILKILGCFLMPSAGKASVAGFSVETNPNEIRSLIGFLPDEPPLYNEMTVEKYLRFVAQIKNVPSADVSKHVDEAIQKVNLDEVRKFRLDELSHGFRQRVGIAQALVHGPKVLILDEPITGLDPIQIVEMRDLILSLRGKHTVILSSHILSEITKTCDRILIVDQGKLIAEGTESDLQARVATRMHLACEVDKVTDALYAKIRNVSGVKKVETKSAGAENILIVETEGECRAEVAKAIIASGAGLLGLTRDEIGLENLFMRFVH